MGTTTCLFSRAKPSTSTSKKVRGFLSLPGELRNHIYQYYFESEFRCEVTAKGRQFKKRKPPTAKLWASAFHSNGQMPKHNSKTKDDLPIIIRISRPLGRYNIVQGLQTNWFASLYAINLVCKQVHTETLAFLYHKTLFVFDAPNRITNFLDVVSKSNLEHITKLELHYTTYGCPKMTKDCIWQYKHNQSWISACASASKKLVSLHKLKVWLQVHHDPLRFNLRQAWILPLLQFRWLTRSSKHNDDSSVVSVSVQQKLRLEVVEVYLRTAWSGSHFDGNQELAKASEELHRLFGQAISLAVLGEKEENAMAHYSTAWEVKYAVWQYHLGYGKMGW